LNYPPLNYARKYLLLTVAGVELREASPNVTVIPLISSAPRNGGVLDPLVGVIQPPVGVVPDISVSLPW